MNSYYEDNQMLLTSLQNETEETEIHGVRMLVKRIPDPSDTSVLDPRVEKDRAAESAKKNPWAECLEIPVQAIRQSPGYPNRDVTTGEIEAVKQIITTRNGETPVWIYRPAGGKKIKSAMVFFHGGAFIAGSTKEVENFCRLLAELADTVILSVDYRLSPEYYFPVALYDCYDAVCWTWEHAEELGIDRTAIAVGGDSAGGSLAIGCSLLERDAVNAGERENGRICYEALLYPAVLVDNIRLEDYRWRLGDYGIPETDQLAIGAALSLKAMTAEMPVLYMGKEGPIKEPIAAPLCQDSLNGLPPTLMILCQYDYLRLSAEAFARKLIRDGVPGRTILYSGMDHAFIDKLGAYPQAYDAAVEIAKDMRDFIPAP